MSDIPDWAFNRVVELAGCEPVIPDDKPHVAHQRAFARYIAEHEEPPVDPLVSEANLIASSKHRWLTVADYEGGKAVALAALKRGIEIGESK